MLTVDLCRLEHTISDLYDLAHKLRLFSQDYYLTPPMLCVLILYMRVETYTLKSTLNYTFLRNFSWQFYLLSEFLPEIEFAEYFFIFYFCWRSLTWGLNQGFTSNKPIHYLLDTVTYNAQN